MKNSTQTQEEQWWKTAVIYQIYPLSFKDTNNDGKGDLPGIIKKLDYLNDGTQESLGVNAIWLSPIYKSPMADSGYDVSDYYDIDPVFGDLKTLENLIAEAHHRGMKVIMDFIPNHTSSQHPWFIESRSSRDNPKRNWYIWSDPKSDGSPPNNWVSMFGGSAWAYDKKTKQYYLHSFLAEQPDLNWRNLAVIHEMQNALRFWMERGVDGFRTDALYHLIKDEEFRDDPPSPSYVPGKDNPYNSLRHIYSQGRPDLIPTIDNFCSILGEKRGSFMVGEMWIGIKELSKFYQACTDKLHLPFNFNLINLPWNAQAYRQFIDSYDKALGENNWPNYVLGNHDQPRVASRIGQEQARMAAMLLLTLRGTPFIYYGEEIGMENRPILSEEACDPWEKRVPGMGLGRDPERTPMQWNAEVYAGFSQVEPWLPVAKNYHTINVEAESSDLRSMLSLYRRLIHYRKSSPALLSGTYRSLDLKQKDVFSFLRESDTQTILVLLNFSDKEQRVSLEFEKAKLVCNTFLDKELGQKANLKSFLLRPNEGYVFTF